MVGAMKRIWFAVVALSAVLLFGGNQTSHAQQGMIDLSQWTPPDIGVVGDDPFGKLVKYRHELFTNTANEIGPAVADVENCFSRLMSSTALLSFNFGHHPQVTKDLVTKRPKQ